MATIEIDGENFQSRVARTGIVIVDCWASWCGACTKFAPVFESVARLNPSHTFAKLNAQGEKALLKKLDIEHIPTLMLFRDGILLFKQAGYLDENGLQDIVNQAEGLDMDEVRSDMGSDQDED